MAPQDKPAQGKALKDKGKIATDPAARGVARTEARLPKGFRDIEAGEIRQMQAMLAKIRGVYESLWLRSAGDAGDSSTRTHSANSCPTGPAERGRLLVPGRRRAVDEPALRPHGTAGSLCGAELMQTLPKPFRRYAIGIGYSATKSRGRAASASSSSSTPTPWERIASPPTRKCACWRPIRSKRWASSAAIT